LEIPPDPVPVATFSIPDAAEHRYIPGIIFLAEIRNPDEIERSYLPQNHTEIKWVEPDRIDLPGDECVPNLAETAKMAKERRMANTGATLSRGS
jgi:hypothetical protein